MLDSEIEISTLPVLILVLVEFTLWLSLNSSYLEDKVVLILVLVEFTLWFNKIREEEIKIRPVLILVLVEFTLWSQQ